VGTLSIAEALLPGAVAPTFGDDDFLALIQNLMPPGRAWAWARDPASVGYELLVAIAHSEAQAHATYLGLLADAPVGTLRQMLPEWEATLGLPDPCLAPIAVIAAREAAVKARLAATGGQSIPYYKELAVNLGGSITVTEYAPFRIGVDYCWSPIRNIGWAYTWLVTLSSGAIFDFEIGISAAWEPFWQISNGPIQCEIERLKPGHTLVNFALAPGVIGGTGWFISDFSLTDSGAVVQ
jgi:uncharacterized protein YmfQ (DUF2313 family)